MLDALAAENLAEADLLDAEAEELEQQAEATA